MEIPEGDVRPVQVVTVGNGNQSGLLPFLTGPGWSSHTPEPPPLLIEPRSFLAAAVDGVPRTASLTRPRIFNNAPNQRGNSLSVIPSLTGV